MFAPFACVLLLGACSGGEDGAGERRQETALEGLTPERMCDLLPNDAIEQTLNVVVKDAEGREAGRPPIVHKYCRYDIEFALQDVDDVTDLPAVSTSVEQTRNKGVEELLDYAFTDLMDDNKKVGSYERVEGLGDGAGYGEDPTLADTLGESKLVVVFTAGEERFMFDLAVSPSTPLEKLKPLATDLLAALEAELR